MTKPIQFKTAASPIRYDLLNFSPSGLEGLSDTFTKIDKAQSGLQQIFRGPIPTELDGIRAQTEGIQESEPTEPLSPPRVPSFDRELRPLIPKITGNGTMWRETLNEIENHYASLQRDTEEKRMNALQTIATAIDVAEVQRQQTYVRQLEEALFATNQELLKLQSYRRNTLESVG